MAIPIVSRDQVDQALARFDTELRDAAAWHGWEDNKAHKFAIVANGRRYPVKEVIRLATGYDRFSGGTESIAYLAKLGVAVEALRLPSEGEVKIALHELLLARHPAPVTPEEAYDTLAQQFGLSAAQRSVRLASTNELHWPDRVRQARQLLVDQLVVDPAERGVWRLVVRDTPRVWVEKTIVQGRPDREAGEFALGRAIWSPTRSENGADIYSSMRLVQPGDVVLHLCDNRAIRGVSVADSFTRADFMGVPGTDWSDRPGYRVMLRGYAPLDPPLDREEFLGAPAARVRLQDIHRRHKKLFYNADLDLNQGAYLTEAPAELLAVFNDIHRAKTGAPLPHLAVAAVASPLIHARLEAAVLLLKWTHGEAGFAAAHYLEDERNYKEALAREWQALATPANFAQALNSETPEVFATALVAPLLDAKKSNFLPWRYNDVLKRLNQREAAVTFLTATQALLFDPDRDRPAIDEFNAAMLPLYRAALNETAVKPASHVIPSLMLWLSEPDRQFLVRPDLYNRLAVCLTGAGPAGQGNVMTTDYYRQAVALARTLAHELRPLGARDLIDVQGFAWTVFRFSTVWFGGKTYHGSTDMLPEFVRRGVYAVRSTERPELTPLLTGIETLNKADREARRAQLEAQFDTDRERNAVLGLFDLAAAPGSLLLAKSTWYDRGRNASMLRIAGVAVTRKGVEFDPAIGHQLAVEWRSLPDYVVTAGSAFPKVNATVSRLPLAEALDLLAPAQQATDATEPTVDEPPADDAAPAPVERQPRYTLADFVADTAYPEATVRGWHGRLHRKQQVIFQGPPGTGKTFVVERLARLLVSETPGFWDVVQFHPSYGYEDFMQGIRPRIVAGQLTYELESGRFLDFCQRAAKVADSAPCVLIIDEVNRADLARAFGELMYLLEYRDKEIALASGTPFRIPSNVYLIGTMNTADRSIALVDHALRRRFSFIHLGPDYSVLAAHLARHGLPADGLVTTLAAINKIIDDRNYEIGVSFFMKDGPHLKAALAEIWRGEIEPYLEEYFYDQPAKVDAFRWDTLATSDLAAWHGD